jgi:hypothetical protein
MIKKIISLIAIILAIGLFLYITINLIGALFIGAYLWFIIYFMG